MLRRDATPPQSRRARRARRRRPIAQALADAPPDKSLYALLPFYRPFVEGIHRTLYALILGIADNFLQSANVAVLSECVKISLVADIGPAAAAAAPDALLATPGSPPRGAPGAGGETTLDQRQQLAQLARELGALERALADAQRRERVATGAAALAIVGGVLAAAKAR